MAYRITATDDGGYVAGIDSEWHPRDGRWWGTDVQVDLADDELWELKQTREQERQDHNLARLKRVEIVCFDQYGRHFASADAHFDGWDWLRIRVPGNRAELFQARTIECVLSLLDVFKKHDPNETETNQCNAMAPERETPTAR